MTYFRRATFSTVQSQYLTIWDLVLTPLYLLVLLAVAIAFRNKEYPIGHPLRSYYLPGLLAKFGGAIFIALLYQFYYGSGDTFNYFNYGRLVNSALDDSFETWLNLMLRQPASVDPYIYKYASQIEFYHDPSSFMIVRLSALFSLLTFNTYLPAALLFAFIAYSGIWAMFKTFVTAYPALHKQMAFAFLFIPSVLVWGSAIFKDTVCMFALGWMTYTTFRIFVDRNLRPKNFLLLAASFYLLAIIKIYILLAFLPSLSLWLLLTYSSKIKSVALRITSFVLVAIAIVFAFVYFASVFAAELNSYSLSNIAGTLEVTRSWIVYSSGEEGSAYDLGEIDPNNVSSLLFKFPAAVVVTLFRPFLWEVRKPIMLLSAMEGLFFLVLLLRILVRNGILVVFKKIFGNPNLSFFFVYSLIFAFAVGISSGNFGTLSRYKIPCMPFFAAMLIVLYYSGKPDRERKIINTTSTKTRYLQNAG